MDALRKAAEAQMRRAAPDATLEPASKKARKGRSEGVVEDPESDVGRYQYNAVDLLLSGSQSFLVTCQMQRERSAVKEIREVLVPYLLKQQRAQPAADPAAKSDAPQQQEGSTDPTNEAPAPAPASSAVKPAPEAATADAAAAAGPSGSPAPGLPVAKVSGSGLLLLLLQPSEGDATQYSALQAVQALIKDHEHGKLKKLTHCQRVTPLAITTRASQEELRRAVQQLAQQQAQQLAEDGKIYFSVAYKNRGRENMQAAAPAAAAAAAKADAATEPAAKPAEVAAAAAEAEAAAADPAKEQAGADDAAGSKASSSSSAQAQGLDRAEAIACLAQAFIAACKDAGINATVNLKAPQVVLMAEVVPVGTQLMCGLCLLGKELITVKPRTNVKSLCA